MDHGTDDDPALRSLAEDLARDDPRLAALLDGTGSHRPGHPRRRHVVMAALPVLVALALLLPPTVALGATAMLLAVASPLAVCWLCATDGTAPHPH